jgi:hypothetical protein
MMKGRRTPPRGRDTEYFRNTEAKIKYLNITNMPTTVDWRGKASPPVRVYNYYSLRLKVKDHVEHVGHSLL